MSDLAERLKCIGKWSGRGGLPAAILITHCSLLLQYLVQYENDGAYYLLYGTTLPVLASWVYVMKVVKQNWNRLRQLWFLLMTYTWCFFVPLVGMIFGVVVIEDKLLSSKFFGPNVLRNILCIAPFQMLALIAELQVPTVNTPSEEMVSSLSYALVVDWFDGIEMLEVLVHESHSPNQIPRELEIVLLTAISGFFLLSPLELLQLNFKEGTDGSSVDCKLRKRVAYLRCVLQGLVNVAFFILRLVLWIGYGRDAAIFMAKNTLSLMLLGREVWSLRHRER